MHLLKRKIKKTKEKNKEGGRQDYPPGRPPRGGNLPESAAVHPPPYLDNCQLGLQCSPGPQLIVSGGCCHFVLGVALSALRSER